MNSNEQWYTIDDLASMSLDGLKGSKATLHRRAVKEGWLKRQREGVKGVAFEYHVNSLPSAAQLALGVTPPPSSNRAHRAERVMISSELISILESLTSIEQQELTHTLKRKGVEVILYLLDDDNLKLLQLPDEEKERLMALHEAKKGASEGSQENELNRPTHKVG